MCLHGEKTKKKIQITNSITFSSCINHYTEKNQRNRCKISRLYCNYLYLYSSVLLISEYFLIIRYGHFSHSFSQFCNSSLQTLFLHDYIYISVHSITLYLIYLFHFIPPLICSYVIIVGLARFLHTVRFYLLWHSEPWFNFFAFFIIHSSCCMHPVHLNSFLLCFCNVHNYTLEIGIVVF